MKEKIASIAVNSKEIAFVSGGVTAPVWMQTMNDWIGFLVGVFTLIYVIWRVVEIIPKAIDKFYRDKGIWVLNWKKRKKINKEFKDFIKSREKHNEKKDK